MSDADSIYMGRALELAARGKGLASPNPMVGAVLVKNMVIVGEGFHTFAGLKHAEVLAIERAGESARGATLYTNLEPCCHTGRTPPCSELLLRSGIVRVVAAMEDPNPQVAGEGLRNLRQGGVAVSLGLLRQEAQRLNEAFAKYITVRRPFISLKAGITLDGKLADFRGESKWITSEEARQRVQQLRFENDAVLVGIGTVLKDDPLLTDRTGQPRRRPLVRVVLDSRLQLPVFSQLIRSSIPGDIMVFCSLGRDPRREAELTDLGANVILAPVATGRIPFDFVLEELGRREIASLLVEGGAEINYDALQSNQVDKLILFMAPKILGGKDSVPMVGGTGFGELQHSQVFQFASVERIGPDLAIEAYPPKART
jgi:diaminohydroxyphosphoribosylaminopyrimidine deaminase/5-amino-6-(5-phosphoribosylamino)uracil reductase